MPRFATTAPCLPVIFLAVFLAGCGRERPPLVSTGPTLRPPVFDNSFRQIWDDGASEVSTYTTVRLRNGAFRKGTATSIMRRTNYSEDERVPLTAAKPSQADMFPAMEVLWLEQFGDAPENGEEMTTSALALSSVDGRVAGSETKANFSSIGGTGQLFHQLLFDATGVRSHQYSYFESEGDEQITLPYPRDGVSGDALWFWARQMAAPALQPGEHSTVSLLPALLDARSQHRALLWKTAQLSREKETSIFGGIPVTTLRITSEVGSETFLVGGGLPFHVLHWERTDGEHADWISSRRVKPTNGQPVPAPQKLR